jgi:hypothetical protein
MTIQLFQTFIGWCAVINYGLLLFWAAIFILVHDRVYRLHSQWFDLTKERFDALHYLLMGVYKILVLVFFVIPYFAILLTT